MRKFNKLWLSLFLILGFSVQIAAQTHGTAAKPLVSTDAKPIYYYIELVVANEKDPYYGNVILPGDDSSEGKLKHGALTGNEAAAKWQIINNAVGLPVLKNVSTGQFMSASMNYATEGDRFDVFHLGSDVYKIYSGSGNPSQASDGNRLNSNTGDTNTKWYFVVASGSETNYNNGNGNYFTLYGKMTRDDNYRKLNSISFTNNDNEEWYKKTVVINQPFGGPNYFDKTSEIIYVKRGDKLKIQFNWDGWAMHTFAYVDWSNDANSLSFSNDERIGYKNTGTYRDAIDDPIVYTIPNDKPLGDYRMRLMIDWDKATGYGLPNHVRSDFYQNAGNVTDVILRVANDVVPAPKLSFGANTLIVKNDIITIDHFTETTVKYTTDGSDPATSSTAIESDQVPVTGNMTLKAIAIKNGVNSDVFVRDIQTIDLTLGEEYYVKSKNSGDVNVIVIEDMGDAQIMMSKEWVKGKAEQRWLITKGTAEGCYKMTSIAGNTVYWDTDRFKTAATPPAGAQVDLRIIASTNTLYPNLYEIQRKESTTNAMNPLGGTGKDKPIGEYTLASNGNVMEFISSGKKFIVAGNWSEATNWYDGIKPNPVDNVTISAAATLDEPATVNNLKIESGATLVPQGTNKLTVNGTTTVEQLVNKPQTYYIGSPVKNMSASANIGNAITFTEETDTWSAAAAFSNPTPGKGYGVQVGSSSDTDQNVTISFTGILNGAVDINITSLTTGKRFNFLGNPYPSYLDAKAAVDNNPKVEKTIWRYFRVTKGQPYQFSSYNTETGITVGAVAIDNYIPPMQGFWIRLRSTSDPKLAVPSGTHQFNFTNAMRTHTASAQAFRAPQASDKQVLRLQVSNGAVSDEAVVLFSENANSDWNSSKLMNPGLSIYTIKAAENLALNSRTAIEYDVETAVGVKAESGVYTFSASEYNNFGAEKAFLVDKVANVATDLSSGDYTVNFTEAYEGTDRFALVFPRSGVISGLENAEATGFFAFANNNRISVNSDAQTGTIYVFNGLGQQVAAQAVSGNLTTVSTTLPAGVYLVKLNNLTTKVVVK